MSVVRCLSHRYPPAIRKSSKRIQIGKDHIGFQIQDGVEKSSIYQLSIPQTLVCWTEEDGQLGTIYCRDRIESE